ncbi:MAG TPA: hypothetical protein VNJ11_03420 [Bryobacteraceae bacterium]|nr:hypothetical protein [Bryobacteraceae bacterium]
MRRPAEAAARLRRAVEREQWQEALAIVEEQAAGLEADPDAAAEWEQVRPLWEWAHRQAVAARAQAAAALGRLALLRQYHPAPQRTEPGGRWRG